MTLDDLHPPANRRCQIYSETTAVRCTNLGTHWEKWGGSCSCYDRACSTLDCAKGFRTWECNGPHRFSETNSAVVPPQQEAA